MADASSYLIQHLMESALWGSLMAGLLWSVLRIGAVRRALGPSCRHLLWWLVCLRLLVGLLPLGSVVVHIRLPAEAQLPVAVSLHQLIATRPLGKLAKSDRQLYARERQPYSAIKASDKRLIKTSVPLTHAHTATSISPITAAIHPFAPQLGLSTAVTIWALGVFAMLGLALCQWLDVRRIVGSATPAPEGVQIVLRRIAADARLVDTPELLVHDDATAPMIAGMVRPVIVLPSAIVSIMQGEDLACVLAHELAHARRRDLWSGIAPLICRALFWFLPTAWLAARECALCAEEACDWLAARTSHSADVEYLRVLVDLSQITRRALHAQAGAAMLSPAFRTLARRIESLRSESASRPGPDQRRAVLAMAVAGLATLVPAYHAVGYPLRPLPPLPSLLPNTPATYEIIDLGSVVPGRSVATAISSDGRIAGYRESMNGYPHARAVAWGGEKPIIVPTPATYHYARASAVDPSGDLALSLYNREGWTHPAIGTAGAVKPLPAIYGFKYGAASAISDDGSAVAGYVYRSRRFGRIQGHAAVWTRIALQDLGTLGGAYSEAYGMSSDGDVVVGKSDTASGATHAFLWRGNTMQDLGAFDPSGNSIAYAVNESGQAAGYASSSPAGPQHAALWGPGASSPIDLGTLPGGSYSKARAITGRGDVVGVSTTRGAYDPHAVLWSGGRPFDLNQAASATKYGWVLRYALSIDAGGEIVGVGEKNGQARAFLLHPR